MGDENISEASFKEMIEDADGDFDCEVDDTGQFIIRNRVPMFSCN